jgi:hypothetical protein
VQIYNIFLKVASVSIENYKNIIFTRLADQEIHPCPPWKEGELEEDGR